MLFPWLRPSLPPHLSCRFWRKSPLDPKQLFVCFVRFSNHSPKFSIAAVFIFRIASVESSSSSWPLLRRSSSNCHLRRSITVRPEEKNGAGNGVQKTYSQSAGSPSSQSLSSFRPLSRRRTRAANSSYAVSSATKAARRSLYSSNRDLASPATARRFCPMNFNRRASGAFPVRISCRPAGV
jgi:hypothetical protein